MRHRMTKEEIVNWIESTVDAIKELLDKERIPYTDSWIKNDVILDGIMPYYTHQLLFPWDEGDVVIGTLHCFDDDVIYGKRKITYPSIETYQFPFDHDDITVFDTPEEFVKTLKHYYISKEENHAVRDSEDSKDSDVAFSELGESDRISE